MTSPRLRSSSRRDCNASRSRRVLPQLRRILGHAKAACERDRKEVTCIGRAAVLRPVRKRVIPFQNERQLLLAAYSAELGLLRHKTSPQMDISRQQEHLLLKCQLVSSD